MSEKQKILGVIGGLGPLATAYFMELVVQMTDVPEDQRHLPMIVYNMPQIGVYLLATGHVKVEHKTIPVLQLASFFLTCHHNARGLVDQAHC